MEALEVYSRPIENWAMEDRAIEDLVPEYRSKNPFVRWVFWERLRTGFGFVKSIEPAPQRILDAGCGDGTFFKLFSGDWPGKLWGLDRHPKVEELSALYPHCVFRRGDLANVELPHQSFDVITCFDVLEHIPEVTAILRKFKDILAPDGYLIVSLPTENAFYRSMRYLLKGSTSRKAGPASGPHYYCAKQLKGEILSTGFKEVTETEIPYQSPFDLFQVEMYRSLRS
jgi:SAM-dependent methyltransferase